MNGNEATAGWAREEFARNGTHGGAATALREAALARFAAHGLPTTRDEDWKYTNVSVLERRRHPTAAPPAAVPQPAALAPWRISGLGAHFAAILVGWFQPALTQAGGAPPGHRLL
ncbi:MAG: Fe-S cluster assembly protein SufD, partial [Gammaproteobacteria bacterium]